MLYGFTDRGCLSRRILMTWITSWTSPFSRSLKRRPITPSETYSTRPSREDRGLSSLTSAVRTHVAPVDLSCLQRANSFSRRSVSFAKSMFSRLIESIATREAPLRLMKSGSSERRLPRRNRLDQPAEHALRERHGTAGEAVRPLQAAQVHGGHVRLHRRGQGRQPAVLSGRPCGIRFGRRDRPALQRAGER